MHRVRDHVANVGVGCHLADTLFPGPFLEGGNQGTRDTLTATTCYNENALEKGDRRVLAAVDVIIAQARLDKSYGPFLVIECQKCGLLVRGQRRVDFGIKFLWRDAQQ